jgi:RNA polymerase sigma-70 factor (ECF subfamily)
LLLRLADAGDGAAWREFLDVYERAIYRSARGRGLQPADAEDVTQRVLAAVIEKAPNWQPDTARGSFGAWLFRVTRNLAARAWNDRLRHPIGSGDSGATLLLEQVPEPPEAEQTAFRIEYRRALFHWAAERVRQRVQESTWRAFWMTTVEGRDSVQVATELRLSLASVYTAKCRMLTRIRAEIDRFEREFAVHYDRD